jgi:glutathione synthase/RimK-type ligase-like ATP-grasp enzyme
MEEGGSMKIRFEPYKLKSKGCRAVADHLGVLRTTPRQVRRHGDFDVIINWGSSQRRFPNARYINDPEAVAHASDKKASFESFTGHNVPCPDWTDDEAVASEWRQDGVVVVARTLLRANQGRGIVLSSSENGIPLPHAPLYTKYIKKADEYRVHVMAGQVIDVAQKKKKREVDNEDVDYQIRSYDNGWVFCRDGVDCPDPVRDAALAAVSALNLDFGAVDVGWNLRRGAAFVFEVNTAPGVEGTTLERYNEGLRALLPALRSGRFEQRRAQ